MSKESLAIVKKLLVAVADREEITEQQRQILASMDNFEAGAVFANMDKDKKNYLTIHEIQDLLKANEISSVSEDSLACMVKYFDSMESDRLSMNDFIQILLPCANDYLRHRASNRRLGPDTDAFSKEVQEQVSTLIQKECEFHKEIEAIKKELQESEGFDAKEVFKAIDVHKRDYLDSSSIAEFLSSQGFKAGKPDLNSIIRRFDVTADAKISYHEFLEGVSPADAKIPDKDAVLRPDSLYKNVRSHPQVSPYQINKARIDDVRREYRPSEPLSSPYRREFSGGYNQEEYRRPTSSYYNNESRIPTESHGTSSPHRNPDPYAYGEERQRYGFEDRKYNFEERNYGKLDREYPQEDRNYQRDERRFPEERPRFESQRHQEFQEGDRFGEQNQRSSYMRSSYNQDRDFYGKEREIYGQERESPSRYAGFQRQEDQVIRPYDKYRDNFEEDRFGAVKKNVRFEDEVIDNHRINQIKEKYSPSHARKREFTIPQNDQLPEGRDLRASYGRLNEDLRSSPYRGTDLANGGYDQYKQREYPVYPGGYNKMEAEISPQERGQFQKYERSAGYERYRNREFNCDSPSRYQPGQAFSRPGDVYNQSPGRYGRENADLGRIEPSYSRGQYGQDRNLGMHSSNATPNRKEFGRFEDRYGQYRGSESRRPKSEFGRSSFNRADPARSSLYLPRTPTRSSYKAPYQPGSYAAGSHSSYAPPKPVGGFSSGPPPSVPKEAPSQANPNESAEKPNIQTPTKEAKKAFGGFNMVVSPDVASKSGGGWSFVPSPETGKKDGIEQKQLDGIQKGPLRL